MKKYFTRLWFALCGKTYCINDYWKGELGSGSTTLEKDCAKLPD